ncbi:MAG: CBS domain-containing protein [Actinomycetota bacterium]
MSPISAVVGPEHTLRQAATRMVHNRTGAAVVIDGSLPGPGVITERDLLIAVAGGLDPDEERVGNHMKSDLVTSMSTWPLARAAGLMVRHGVRHVLIIDGEELVGILSMRDVVRVSGLTEHLEREAAATSS